METIVFILMVLVAIGFLLKLTWSRFRIVAATAGLCALFTGAALPWAVEQSRTQIADWLADPALMLDTAVVLTLEVVVQMAFCLLAVHVRTAGALRSSTLRWYRALRLFPGVLLFPVLFSILVAVIFSFPGVSFELIGWGTAVGVLAAIPVGSRLLLRLLPEEEVRLELLFLVEALIAVLGIVATVNGRTAVVAESPVDWSALAGVLALAAAGASAGLLVRRWRLRRTRRRIKS
ncbi:MAG: hypothetical protein K2K30_05830 [Alistipes sp.]|nr:hypothetical protein [Alistipes sp.]MDE6623893.1 hypothetical protein [Alistipes sp.]